jgi:lipopolysaccharide export system protein LptA
MSSNQVTNVDKFLMGTDSSDYSFVLKGDSTSVKNSVRGKLQDTGASGSSAEAGFSFRDSNDNRIGYNVMSGNVYYIGSDLPNAETLIRSGSNKTALKADGTQNIEIPSGNLQFTNNHDITGGSGNTRFGITSGSTEVKSQTGQTLFTGWSGGQLRIIDDGSHPVTLYDEGDGGAMVKAEASTDTVELIDPSTDTAVLTSNPGGNQNVEVGNGELLISSSPDYNQVSLGHFNNTDDFELDIDHGTQDRIRWIRNPSAQFSFQIYNNSTDNTLLAVKDDGKLKVDSGDIDQSGSNGSFIHDRQTVSGSAVTDGSGYYSVDSSGGTRTLTLSTTDAADGKEINVKRNGPNSVTVDTEGSETIDDSNSFTLSGDNDSITVVYNSSNSDWEIY